MTTRYYSDERYLHFTAQHSLCLPHEQGKLVFYCDKLSHDGKTTGKKTRKQWEKLGKYGGKSMGKTVGKLQECGIKTTEIRRKKRRKIHGHNGVKWMCCWLVSIVLQ